MEGFRAATNASPYEGATFYLLRATRESVLLGRPAKATRTSASPLVCQVATNVALGTAAQHAGTAGGRGQSYR